MLRTILLVTAISVFLELRVVNNIHVIRRFAQWNTLTGLAVSFVIAILIGKIFGMSGTIIGSAAMFTAVITGLVYAFRRQMEDPKLYAAYESIKDFYSPILKIFKYSVYLILAPIWLPLKYKQHRDNQQDSLKTSNV